MSSWQPTPGEERIGLIDTIRGCALLGILLMNILDFAMPGAAYANLNVMGGRYGASLYVFIVQYILFEGKMRGLFSLMFGASIVLLTERGLARGEGVAVADLYYRRTLWLALIGLIHGYLIWHGDILFPYAMCGLALFPFRNVDPRRLLSIGGAALALLTIGAGFQGFETVEMKEKGQKAQALEKGGAKLTDEQKKEKEKWEEAMKNHFPPPDELKKTIDDFRGSYAKALKRRAEQTHGWHSEPLYMPNWADFWAMMLIGMALLRLGVLQGQRDDSFYMKMALAGYGIGIPVNAATVWALLRYDFSIIVSVFAYVPYEIGRASVTLAHLATIILIAKRGWFPALRERLAAVGQTALSNYLATSVICTFIFYGHGLRQYAQLQRWQLYLVVLGVWAFNLAVSRPWLERYRFGPVEWCWRSLTYWERQPMRRQIPV